MCGIIGYTGFDEAMGVLLKGLKSLEYRGYDSAGIAVSERGKTNVVKCTGRVKNLAALTQSAAHSHTGIGHTRWATHGGVSEANAHPHKFGSVTVVHNGIIENYEALRDALGVKDSLKSQTDSEVAAALIEHCRDGSASPYEAICRAVKLLGGTFALAIMFDDLPDEIYAVRNVSPIVCCQNESGAYIASDIIAIGEYSENYFVLPELAVAKITASGFEIKDLNGREIEPQMLTLDRDIKNSGKCGYPFYMEKEICEQPSVIKKTIESRIKDGLPDLTGDGVSDELLEECSDISVIACGTAMHAGLVLKHLVESVCGVSVNVYMASEFIYGNPIIRPTTLAVCISQSGETIDTLEALKYAKKAGASSLSIVNVRSSSIARESDYVIYTDAGPEIAVASTKAYTTQLAVIYLLTARMAYARESLNYEGVTSFIKELEKVPEAVSQVIDGREKIHRLAGTLLSAEHAFMIGRGFDYPLLLEGSLKLKEISYIHSEAFASGELKHGTIALITQGTPVIALITQQYLAPKQLSNIREVQSRGARVITFVKKSLKIKELECSFELPEIADEFTAAPAVTALQLLAYYVSADKGLDVDKPRNLAKVVTVE